jgi:hyperosmotically inducible periplasmic protein
MKTIIILLIVIAAGTVGYRYYQQRNAPTAVSLAESAKETMADARDAVADKFTEWHLTPDEIKADLKRTGEVVRNKTKLATEKVGEEVSDARIVSTVKGKYVLDRHLSALDINVDSSNGAVTLRGTVAAEEFIGRAIVLALETDGVSTVTSKLVVEAKPVETKG